MEIGIVIGSINNVRNIITFIIKVLSLEDTITRKIANAHRLSAIQALEAAQISNSVLHLTSALGHMRDVYNLLESEIKSKPKLTEKIIESYILTGRLQKIESAYLEAIKIGILIFNTHIELEKYDQRECLNANKWGRYTFSLYMRYYKFVKETEVVYNKKEKERLKDIEEQKRKYDGCCISWSEPTGEIFSQGYQMLRHFNNKLKKGNKIVMITTQKDGSKEYFTPNLNIPDPRFFTATQRKRIEKGKTKKQRKEKNLTENIRTTR